MKRHLNRFEDATNVLKFLALLYVGFQSSGTMRKKCLILNVRKT